MERRHFMRRLGYTVLAGFATLFGSKVKNVEALTEPILLAQAGSDLPSSCQNKSAKGLSRCKGHTGSCEGDHHACSGHQPSRGTKGCGKGKTVQCAKHGNKEETTH